MGFNGERLKRARKQKNMTQWDLAERLHVARPTITMWETGKNAPTADMLAELAAIFDCSVDYLLGLTEDATPLPSNVRPITDLHRQRIPLRGGVGEMERETPDSYTAALARQYGLTTGGAAVINALAHALMELTEDQQQRLTTRLIEEIGKIKKPGEGVAIPEADLESAAGQLDAEAAGQNTAG